MTHVFTMDCVIYQSKMTFCANFTAFVLGLLSSENYF